MSRSLSVEKTGAHAAALALLGSALALGGAAGGQIRAPVARSYIYDFEKAPGREWSSRKIDITAKGRRRFLGRFCNEEARLTLTRLPPHRYLRVSFELFILRTWDGRDSGTPGVGPDVWSLKLGDGRELLRATFANRVSDWGNQQTFPDTFPGPLHGPQTGATEKDTLGAVPAGTGDSVYRLSFVFPHTGPEVTLIFADGGLEPMANENWGLDNVKVDLLPGHLALRDTQLKQHWRALKGDDPLRAFEAYRALMASGEQAAALAAERLRPTNSGLITAAS